MSQERLSELVDQHYDRLFRAARFMCGSTAVAEDLVQEAFLGAAKSLARFQGRSSAYTWLYSILLNKFRRWLRKSKRSTLSLQGMAEDDQGDSAGEVLETGLPGPIQNAERHEAAQLVRAAIGGLTADHCSVITLRFMEGMSYEEIARTLDCPVGTVKSRIHYALLRIEEDLAGAAGPPD